MTRRRAICNSNTKGGPTTYQYQSNQSLLLFSFKALIPNILRKTFKLRQFEMFWSFFCSVQQPCNFLFLSLICDKAKHCKAIGGGNGQTKRSPMIKALHFIQNVIMEFLFPLKKMYLLFQEENSLRIQIFIFGFCDLGCIACKRVSMESLNIFNFACFIFKLSA